jgi:hypothetical protein
MFHISRLTSVPVPSPELLSRLMGSQQLSSMVLLVLVLLVPAVLMLLAMLAITTAAAVLRNPKRSTTVGGTGALRELAGMEAAWAPVCPSWQPLRASL